MANKAFDPVTYGAAVNAAQVAQTAAELAETNAESAASAAAASALQLASGVASPAGTFADLAALNAADPDHASVYITLDDGKWCYYDSGTSAFVAGGVYQAAALDGEVGELKNALTYVPLKVYANELVLGRSVSVEGQISNTATSSLTGYIEVKPDQVFECPDIKDSNNIQLNFYIATYNSSKVFQSRTLVNGTQLKIDSSVTYVRIMFARPGASGVTMTEAHIATYFNGKIYNMGLKTYEDIQNLLPLLNRQIWFDVNRLELSWTLGRSISIVGDVTNLSTSAISSYVDVVEDEVFAIPLVYDSNSIPITTYIACYNSDKEFIERVVASDDYIKINANTKYIRLMFARASASGITMTEYDIKTYFEGKLYQVGERIQNNLNKLSDIEYFKSLAISTTWTLGITVEANGNEFGATTYAVSDYVDRGNLLGIQTLDIFDANSNKFITFVVCYDKYKRYLGRFSGNVILEPDCAYIRFVFGRASSTGIYPTQNTIKTYFAVNEITKDYLLSGQANKADVPKNLGVRNCILRAKQLAMLKYTTKDVLPNQISDVPANTTVIGAPYSSARLYDKFIGLNVSIHTFMTAINNPDSVVYTEALTTDNAKTFYGTVCSSFTAYCLGSPVREITKKILDNTVDYTTKTLNDIQLGDVCVNNTHIVLIIGIIRDIYGGIVNVITAESLPPHCCITSYTWEGFITYFNGMEYRLASYNDIVGVNYVPSKYVPLMNEAEESITYSPICTNYGDAPLLKIGEDITINILDSTGATSVVVTKDGNAFGTYGTSDFTITDLASGSYEAKLMNGGTSLGSTTWEVCYAEVSKAGTRVSFGAFDNCDPLYISFNDSTGSAYYCIALTDEDIENGYVDTDYSGTGVNVLKIYVGNGNSSTAFSTVIS